LLAAGTIGPRDGVRVPRVRLANLASGNVRPAAAELLALSIPVDLTFRSRTARFRSARRAAGPRRRALAPSRTRRSHGRRRPTVVCPERRSRWTSWPTALKPRSPSTTDGYPGLRGLPAGIAPEVSPRVTIVRRRSTRCRTRPPALVVMESTPPSFLSAPTVVRRSNGSPPPPRATPQTGLRSRAWPGRRGRRPGARGRAVSSSRGPEDIRPTRRRPSFGSRGRLESVPQRPPGA